jgi:adenosine deaminase
VGVNLVQPEDDPSVIQNFAVQMRMLQFLRPLYPNAHLSLHAGELRPQAPPGGAPLTHVRDAIAIAGAERIGHGVDVLGEPDAAQLLAEMARRRVMVEICLTSNDLILGVRGPAHPLAAYIKAGVPVALATDDEGVSRSDMPREFFKAAVDQRLGYLELKTMARASLQYAFVDAGEKARLQSELERAFAAFEARQ